MYFSGSIFNPRLFICSHIIYCRSQWHHDPPANSTDSPPQLITLETPPGGRIRIFPPTQPSPVCPQGLCLNGGVCRPVSLPSGASSFFCDCPLHFMGRLCEQGDTSGSFPPPHHSKKNLFCNMTIATNLNLTLMSGQIWCGALKKDNLIDIIKHSTSPAKAETDLPPNIFTNKKYRSSVGGRCVGTFS